MLRISSFNIQNDFSKYNINKSKEIYNYLVQNKINILGLQEVYSKINKDLIKLLPSKYTYNGNYRFFSKIILNRINEKTPIITDKKVKFSKTYNLPHLPSLLKRVVVKNVINYKGYDISIYNTHLDFMFESVKLRELKYLYKLISKDNNLIILMGDFNLKNNKEIFNKFCSLLEEKGISRVEFNDRTLKMSRYHREIDHVFLSKEFNVENYSIIKDLEISDHYPIVVDVEV